MKLTPNFYRDRVCLNVLAGSKDNAREIYDAAEGHVLVGVLSKNYPDVASAVADMRDYAKLIDNALSVGLGAGDPKPVGDGERDFSPGAAAARQPGLHRRGYQPRAARAE
ncbi:4-hydroxy-2-ketovalerate aldolase [Klebsiella variicola]|uniref:4-hydroxy-2-ketovalerate aldolase n=1 Tax=Klebsiella variicola TaxID=244366 RepID=A0A7H4MC52_KLEVA|nr:4-hydroxy-2-ketovalerate aldolase [Klebsiella variicola]